MIKDDYCQSRMFNLEPFYKVFVWKEDHRIETSDRCDPDIPGNPFTC